MVAVVKMDVDYSSPRPPRGPLASRLFLQLARRQLSPDASLFVGNFSPPPRPILKPDQPHTSPLGVMRVRGVEVPAAPHQERGALGTTPDLPDPLLLDI